MVAAASGVSTAAASKALNGKEGISQEKAILVRKKAKLMGYRPNNAAKTLVTQKSRTIGILYKAGMAHEYCSEVLESIRKEAEGQGYALIFIPNHSSEEMSYLDYVLQRQCDGVILCQGDFDTAQIKELIASGHPVVAIDCLHEGSSAVLNDNAYSMREIAKYLHTLGYEKAAMIHGEMGEVTRIRLEEFRDACKKEHITLEEENIISACYNDPDASEEAVKKILSQDPDKIPEVILFPDDISSSGGIKALKEAGYSIPEDMGIVGYDGIRFSRLIQPVLSTWKQDVDEIGKSAAKVLISQIETDAKKPEVVIVPGTLQKGETLKPRSEPSEPEKTISRETNENRDT